MNKDRTTIKTLSAYTFDQHNLEELESFISYVKEHTNTPSKEINLDFYFDEEESCIVAWFKYEMTDEEYQTKIKRQIESDKHSLKYHLNQVEHYKKKLEGEIIE